MGINKGCREIEVIADLPKGLKMGSSMMGCSCHLPLYRLLLQPMEEGNDAGDAESNDGGTDDGDGDRPEEHLGMGLDAKHLLEVHTEVTREERHREENNSSDGERFHRSVHVVRYDIERIRNEVLGNRTKHIQRLQDVVHMVHDICQIDLRLMRQEPNDLLLFIPGIRRVSLGDTTVEVISP